MSLDKNRNSRFEYTKILNTVHAATLSGLASLRIKRPYVSIFSLRILCIICVNLFFTPPQRCSSSLMGEELAF
ncbi:MAG TPA: hypothetical protein PK899_09765 [Spirochaetota bacterium]|nr:hypothetical protein [Spirochaetota bacterium]